eukprot:10483207-Prorocentrum_lima.AAC.1
MGDPSFLHFPRFFSRRGGGGGLLCGPGQVRKLPRVEESENSMCLFPFWGKQPVKSLLEQCAEWRRIVLWIWAGPQASPTEE